MDKEEAKGKIKLLVDKYSRILAEKRVSKYNEEMTKKEFIEPLFEFLGWDIRNTYSDDEVTTEEKISSKRVDYGFRINSIPKFFLEAKPLKADLDKIEYVEQAINYAWHKGCTWAILTDFESIKIFNAEWKSPNPLQTQFGQTLKCQEFLQNFDQLWLLSKESFEQGLLDKEAEKWGKKAKKTPVDKQLLSDFTRFREMLSKNASKLNQSTNLSEIELDEAIQRLLDRLIFIRNCEDRGLEAKTLLPAFREWQSQGKGQFVNQLREVFDRFDELYNSKIFAKHLCDDLQLDDEVLGEIINGLYSTKDNSVHYDFSAIEADVLGNIYEQYLGHILKKTEKRAKLTESQAHRKKQGIYYTPTYIVDYIVKNTLGELLKDKKVDPEKIRILDPACGSGSFLIKAFDVLNDYYAKKDKDYAQHQLDASGQGTIYSRKTKILENNIFGVDLDKQAVEIAQLNLMLKIAERGHRLPLLQQNIQNGNSLIDDPSVAEDKAFNWNQRFKQIMDDGGFDVVIGNPPYIRVQTGNPLEKDYLQHNYLAAKGKYDLYILFIERGLKLLKPGGRFGFIVPNKFTQTKYGEALKKYILDNYAIEKYLDFGDLKVFEDATTYPCIIIIKNEKPNKKVGNYVKIKELTPEVLQIASKKIGTKYYDCDLFTCFNFKQQNLNIENWSFMSEELQNIYEKISASSRIKLSGVTDKIVQGFITGDNESFIFKSGFIPDIEATLLKKMPKGKNIQKYVLLDEGYKVLYTNSEDKKPLSASEMEKYPKTLEYLKERITQLKQRKFFGKEMSDFKEWWQLVHPVEYKYFQKPKIITPNLSPENRFVLDEEGYFVEHDCYIITLKNESTSEYRYIVALLNSKVIEFFFKQTSPMFSGGYYKYHTQYLNSIPIPEANSIDKNKIILLVDQVVKIKKQYVYLKNKQTDEKVRLEQEIKKLEVEIDKEVYTLYGISDEEQKIIEESLK